MCCSHTCQFSVIAALPPPFLLPPLPSSPPSLPSPFLALPLPLSFLWIASPLILIAYALPCLSYLPPPPLPSSFPIWIKSSLPLITRLYFTLHILSHSLLFFKTTQL